MRQLLFVTLSAWALAACSSCPPQRVVLHENCYHCVPGKYPAHDPAAPGRGSVVLSRDSLYPVRVRYVMLPYIDAGAALQAPGYEHVLTRQFPSDQGYDHTWASMGSQPEGRPLGPPYFLPNHGNDGAPPTPQPQKTQPQMQAAAPEMAPAGGLPPPAAPPQPSRTEPTPVPPPVEHNLLPRAAPTDPGFVTPCSPGQIPERDHCAASGS